jgi:hypothetical protein
LWQTVFSFPKSAIHNSIQISIQSFLANINREPALSKKSLYLTYKLKTENMKKLYTLSIALISAFSFGQNVVITTVVDGSAPNNGCGGTGSASPKAVEMYVTGTVDFTNMRFQTESNGVIPPATISWNTGLDLTPLGTVTDAFVYLVYYATPAQTEPTTFIEMYPSITLTTWPTPGDLPNGNGNDAYRIVTTDGATPNPAVLSVIDQFGNPTDITVATQYNAAWCYQKSYAKRVDGVGSNGGNFVNSSFTYGGNNLFTPVPSTCETIVAAVNLGSYTNLANKSFDIAGLKVYPNPVKGGNLYITSNSNETKAVAIYNVLGKQVLTANVNDAPINVAHLSAGVYIVKITEAGKTATKKLVIE